MARWELGQLAGEAKTPLVPAVLIACGLCYLAQSFSAWAWPALDGYPAIERWLDPSFLTADFYTNTTAPRYGVDTWQGVLFGGVQRMTGVSYALQIAALTALRHLLFPWVLYAFLKAMTRDRATALFGVVLGVLADFSLPRTLGWQWLWGDGSPAMFAAIVATAAWVCLLKRNIWLSLLLMAVATICQPLVAVHGGIFFALVFLFEFDRRERWKALTHPANIAAGLVFGVAFLSQYLLLTPPASERLGGYEYVHILAWERHPTDFLPSRFGAGDYIAFFTAALALALMLVKLWPDLPKRALIVATFVTYAVICVIGSVFVEQIPIRLVADLIPYRTVIIVAPLMVLIAGATAARAWRAADIVTLVLLAGAFVIAGPGAVKLGVPEIAPAVVLLIAAIANLAPDGLKPRTPRLTALAWPLAIAGLLGLAVVAGYLRAPFMVLPTQQNQHPLFAWASGRTQPDARFLIEQFSTNHRYLDAISPQRMRLVGRRPVVASMDYPFADRDLRPWLKTWAAGLDHGALDRVEKASAQDLARICRDLPYDYVVRTTALPGLTPVVSFPPSHGLGEVRVYQPCAMAR